MKMEHGQGVLQLQSKWLKQISASHNMAYWICFYTPKHFQHGFGNSTFMLVIYAFPWKNKNYILQVYVAGNCSDVIKEHVFL